MKTRETSCCEGHWRHLVWVYVFGAVVMLIGIWLLGQSAAFAQDSDPPLPLRGVERDAPDREPVVLETRTLSNGVTSTLFEVPAAADTYIASGRPNQNFGADSLFLGYNAVGDQFGAQRILIRFDIDSFIPENAIIHDADVRLRLNFGSPTDDDPMPTLLRRLASDWAENGVTWNTEPTWGEIRDDDTEIGTAMAWYGWDITQLVQEWLDGTHPNYGVEIIGDEHVQERERAFYAREADLYFPRLVVEYTVSDDDQPPVVTVDGLPAYSPRSFTVSWDGYDQGDAGIDHYDVRYRVDGGAWTDWLVETTETQAEFVGENGRFYEFEARGVDDVGNAEPFGEAEAGTTVDNRPPTSTVDDLPAITKASDFTVSWTGNDAGGSGLQYFNVYYRYNEGAWTPWLERTIVTDSVFNDAEDGFYEFEVWAVDNLGQRETFFRDAEATTLVDIEAPFVVPRLWMPLVFSAAD